MAENEGTEGGPRGNDWEVVSLTASTYAAAPGPVSQLTTGTENSNSVENKDQTPDIMVRSKHFVVPHNPPENEIHDLHKGEVDSSQILSKEGVMSETKEPENISIEKLAMSNPFPEIFNEKGNILGIDGSEFDKGEALQELMSQQESLYRSETLDSIHSEPSVAESIFEEGYVSTHEENDSENLNSPKFSDMEVERCNLPCTAWWKRRALSLYSHAKDASTLWSIFIAAAVMGLVIIGQRLQLKWQGAADERLYRRLAPLSRFKDVIVGGQRRGFLISSGN